MVMHCYVPHCHTTTRHGKQQVHKPSFHRFPFSEPERLEAWLRRLEKYGFHFDKNADEKKKRMYRICSKHFRPEDYQPSCSKAQLKPYAVPSIFETEELHARASSEKTPNHKFLHDHGLYALGTQEDVKQKLENVNLLQEQLQKKTSLVAKERKKAERVTNALQSITQDQGIASGQASAKIARIVKENLRQSKHLTSQAIGQELQNILEAHQLQNVLEVQPDITDVKTPVSDILSRMVDKVRRHELDNTLDIKEEEVDGTYGEMSVASVSEEDVEEPDRESSAEPDGATEAVAKCTDAPCLTSYDYQIIMYYFMDVLGSKINSVKMISVNESSIHPATLQIPAKMTMKFMHKNTVDVPEQVPQCVTLEVNGRHPVIKKLLKIRNKNPQLARLIAEQVYDNARLVAGEMEATSETFFERLNTIMEASMDNKDWWPKQEHGLYKELDLS